MKIIQILFSILLISIISCSGNSGGPVLPSSNPESSLQPDTRTMVGSDRFVLGTGLINISADRTQLETVPLRDGEGHFNIRTFLEDGPCTDCIKIMGFTWSGADQLDVDIQVKHPFPGHDVFTAFDLRMTMIFPATSSWPSNDLTWSHSDAGGGELLNADGCTTTFNPVEFEQGPGGLNLLTYQQGKLATDLDNPSTLNGYIAYYLEPDRRPFYTTQALTRTHSLRIPTGEFQIGYVVDASWDLPDPNPPQIIPDDFPIEANVLEAYRISAHVEEGITETEGDAACIIEVFDWQGTSTISSVSIECPDLFDGILPAMLDTDFGTISRWSLQIENDLGALEGYYPLLIRVDDLSHDPLLGPLAAYFITTAHVGETIIVPPDDVFVDRDYPGLAGGLPEDGSPEAPFTSINTAVLVAPDDVKIHIDPSPDPYDEQVYLKSNRWLYGDNWRNDGDSGLPVIEASEFDTSILGVAVSDIIIEYLEIRPGGDLTEEYLYGIYLGYYDPYEHVQNVTVRFNTFTGDRVHTGNNTGDEVICMEANLTDNFVFEDNLITDVHVGSDQGGYFAALHVDVCDGVTVRRNVITNCTTRNSFLGMRIWYSDLPVLIEDNELSYLHNSDTPTGWCLGWCINVIGYSDVTVRHNTIHDIGLPGHRVEAIPLFFRCVGDQTYYNWNIENNLIYDIYAQDADNTTNSADCRGIMFRLNSSNHLDGLSISNNTIVGLTSGEYVTGLEFDIGSGNMLYNYRIENNIIMDLHGPPTPDPWETSAAVLCYWPGNDLFINYDLFFNIDLPDDDFYGVVLGDGVILDEDPMLFPDYKLPYDSRAQMGNPNFVDWDDTGSPSGDNDNPNPETRSRMGAYGGPGGGW